jgi:hypothetical protein
LAPRSRPRSAPRPCTAPYNSQHRARVSRMQMQMQTGVCCGMSSSILLVAALCVLMSAMICASSLQRKELYDHRARVPQMQMEGITHVAVSLRARCCGSPPFAPTQMPVPRHCTAIYQSGPRRRYSCKSLRLAALCVSICVSSQRRTARVPQMRMQRRVPLLQG